MNNREIIQSDIVARFGLAHPGKRLPVNKRGEQLQEHPLSSTVVRNQ